MNCLLDTHVFLFSLFSPSALSRKAHAILKEPENEVLVSAVTFWEISLKHALGKLRLEGVRADEMPEHCARMGFDTIGLTPQEAAGYHKLPVLKHKDPFDRMLIWQAIQRNIPLLSRDKNFSQYENLGLKVIW
jgi:PIN domain nuclease of toxin-antitoxin system